MIQSRLGIIFGYENGGFMAPPYPYFFDLDGYPDVRLTGMTPELQQRNTVAFQRMIETSRSSRAAISELDSCSPNGSAIGKISKSEWRLF